MVIGSPEPHYSASKVFQSILSGRPILSLLHKDSEALEILESLPMRSVQCGLYAPDDEIQSTMEVRIARLLGLHIMDTTSGGP